jgi:hypothetical protein
VNYPPLLTGTQTQQAWARAFGKNVLAAGANAGPSSSGSGVYRWSGEVLASFYDSDGKHNGSRMLVSNIPSQPDALSSKVVAREVRSSEPWIASEAATEPQHDHPRYSFERQWQATDSSVSILGHSFSQTNVTLVSTSTLSSNITTHLAASVAGAQCSADFVLWKAADDPEHFALVAASGAYNGYFPSAMCSFMRCGSSSAEECLTRNEISSKSLFSAVRVSTSELDGDYTLAMAAADQGALLPNEFVVETNRTVIRVGTGGVAQFTCLDATLFSMYNTNGGTASSRRQHLTGPPSEPLYDSRVKVSNP